MNDCPIDAKRFRRQAAYIMQDDRLQPLLTVNEAMQFSANLKIGQDLSTENKLIRVSVLQPLSLTLSKALFSSFSHSLSSLVITLCNFLTLESSLGLSLTLR